MWGKFAFRVEYVSDEREVEFQEVWIDLNRGAVCEEMPRHIHLVPLQGRPGHHYPWVPELAPAVAIEMACAYADKLAQPGGQLRSNSRVLEREAQRINDYYTELRQETIKRSERKGLAEPKKQELLNKAASIELERAKQLAEIKEK